MASAWAYKHVTVNEAQNGIEKTIHVIDVKNLAISSYLVGRHYIPIPEYVPYVTNIGTPESVQRYMDDVIRAVKNFSASAKALTIPTTVIEGAWEWTNCAYCKNSVLTYLNTTLEGQVVTTATTLANLASTFNLINTSLPDVYKVPLESGGHITMKITLLADPIELDIQVTEVADKEGNVVPSQKANLSDLNVKISEINQAKAINQFINKLRFTAPLRTGRVTIHTCQTIDPRAANYCGQ